jgi:hypothetical protein
MKNSHRAVPVGFDLPLVCYLSVLTGILAGFAAVLYLVLQPTKGSNPGLAAYKPPPAVSLYPVARAPEPPRDFSSVTLAAEFEDKSRPVPTTSGRSAQPHKSVKNTKSADAARSGGSQRSAARSRDERSRTVLNEAAPVHEAPFRWWN